MLQWIKQLHSEYYHYLMTSRSSPIASKSCPMAVFPRPEARAGWHVTIRQGGSPERFHHFLLGFFVPLVYHLSTDWRRARFERLIVRSCGPLDRIMREFGDVRIEIVDRDQHGEMAQVGHGSPRALAGAMADHEPLKFITIRGCDYPPLYDAVKFSKVREVLLSMKATQAAVQSLSDRWPGNGKRRILLIERGASFPYYHSEHAENEQNKKSGRERRSIANHDELYRSLRVAHSGCLSVMTETLTLADQIAAFSLADVIIGQHGAALANLIWARPSATVIEIFPDTARFEQKVRRLFYFLALCNGLRYRKVRQHDVHSAVDIDLVRKVIGSVVASPPSRLGTNLRARAFRCVRPVLPVNQVRAQLFRVYDRAARAR